MKKHFTQLAFTLLVFGFAWQAGTAQNYIWGGPGDSNSEFNGGLNDWTVNAVSPNENALWVWEADGKADRGAYSGKADAYPILSPTVNNGAAVFDSDFYDNDGTPGNFGKGIAPASQVGELVSPTFSTVGHTSVWLQFNQYYRNFQSTTKVLVSNDGGTTWGLEFVINDEVFTNNSIHTDNVVLLDLSEYAADKEEVKFKFRFEANYYFWIIDDVYVLSGAKAEPRITGTWNPTGKYAMPRSQVTTDSFYFVMDVANLGGEDLTSLSAKVSIENRDLETTVYEDEYENIIPEGDTLFKGDTLKFFQFKHYMPTIEAMDTGRYYARYEIYANDPATTYGKTFLQYFRLNANNFIELVDGTECKDTVFSNSYEFSDGNNDGYYSYKGGTSDGVIYNIDYFKTSDWADNERISISAVETNFRIYINEKPAKINPYIFLFELADTLDNQLSNFNFNDGIIVDNNQSTQLTYVGYTSDEVDNPGNREQTTVTLHSEDEEGDELDYVVLKPNKKYFLAMKWDASNTYWQGLDFTTNAYNKMNYYNNRVSFIYGNFEGGARFGHGASTDGIWDMGLNLKVVHDCIVGTEELLPENTVKLMGNPVRNDLIVNINFENTVDKATMIVHDINGQIIDMKTVKNLKESTEKFYVGNLPNGTYIFTIFTKDKSLTKKFVVIK